MKRFERSRTDPVHGNLKSDGEWTYTWDAENRLIGVERSAAALAAGAPYHREKHDYDHRSRRIRTTHFTNSGTTTSSQTLYIFDGWKCVAELNTLSANQPIRKYTWGLDLAGSIRDSSTGNVGALLWLIDTATTKTHIHLYDRNGNVTGLLDTATRKRSATYEYDAFGQLITCYGDYAKSNPFTFSTKFTDNATGLLYYGYRWYDPRTGRWPSRDPIGETGGKNLYGMVRNDALNLRDYLGLFNLGVGVSTLPGVSVTLPGVGIPAIATPAFPPRLRPTPVILNPYVAVTMLGIFTVWSGAETLEEIEAALDSARRLDQIEQQSHDLDFAIREKECDKLSVEKNAAKKTLEKSGSGKELYRRIGKKPCKKDCDAVRSKLPGLRELDRIRQRWQVIDCDGVYRKVAPDKKQTDHEPTAEESERSITNILKAIAACEAAGF